MRHDEKKAAIAAYKERKPRIGIYAVRAIADDMVWVGQTLTLDTVQNRHWFALGLGTHSNKRMQAAWSAHGSENFRYEILEQLSETEPPYHRTALLKAKEQHWRTTLGADAV